MERQDFGAIIDMAIAKEEEAYNFYIQLLSTAESEDTRDTIRFIAAEEQQHKELLVEYREKGYDDADLTLNTIIDRKVTEQLEAPEPASDMGIGDVYLLAAHREKKANELYLSLASIHPDGKARAILLRMAEEELKHKEKMEFLYTKVLFERTAGT